MFYGTINVTSTTATISPSAASSNNFLITKVSGTTGKFTLTFNQYLKYAPTLSLAAHYWDSSNAGLVSYNNMTQANASSPFTVDVYTWKNQSTKGDKDFSFVARSGMRRCFTAPTNLVLTPQVVTFTPSGGTATKVLVLSTPIGSETVFLDKGTVLIAVGATMTIKLSATTVSDGSGNTWQLTGYTYGGGSGPTGTAWSSNGTGPTLTVDPASTGPATTPYSYVIKGVRTAGTGQQYLSSDPVVRLTSVSPGGMKL